MFVFNQQQSKIAPAAQANSDTRVSGNLIIPLRKRSEKKPWGTFAVFLNKLVLMETEKK